MQVKTRMFTPLLRTLIQLFLLHSLTIFILLSKAEAAGIIQEQISPESAPPTPESTPDKPILPNIPTTPESTPDKPILPNIPKPNLDSLGKPYWLNSDICRENNGNIVCVTSEQAKKLRWILPLKNR